MGVNTVLRIAYSKKINLLKLVIGATPSQYGFVFGITNMAAFLTAPFFGRYGSQIGPKLLYNTGAFVQAFAGISFGCLDYIDDNLSAFLGLSYFLRFNLSLFKK